MKLHRTLFCSAFVVTLAACAGAPEPSTADDTATVEEPLSASNAGCSTITAQSLTSLQAELAPITALMQADLTACNQGPDTSICIYLTYGLQNVTIASTAIQQTIDAFAAQGYTTPTMNGGGYLNDQLVKNALPALVRNELYIVRSWQFFSHTSNIDAAYDLNMQAIEDMNDLLARAGRCTMGRN